MFLELTSIRKETYFRVREGDVCESLGDRRWNALTGSMFCLMVRVLFLCIRTYEMQGQEYRYPNKEPSGQTLDGRVQFQWKSSRENSAASAAVSPPDELSIVQYLLCHCVEVVVFPFFPGSLLFTHHSSTILSWSTSLSLSYSLYFLFCPPFFLFFFFPLALFKVERSFRCTPGSHSTIISLLRALSFENVVKRSGEAILAATFLQNSAAWTPRESLPPYRWFDQFHIIYVELLTSNAMILSLYIRLND